MLANENISLKEYPSVHWKKFFDKFSKIESLPIESWDATLIIAYFCKKYEEYYKEKFTFKFNSTSPSKSYEVVQIRKLSSMLSAKPNILKEYVDWFFEEKLIARKRRITSMAFLVDQNIVIEYKMKFLFATKNTTIDRATPLPQKYMEIIKSFDSPITNYGELAFLSKCGVSNQKYKDILDALIKIGLNTSSLDKVK